MFFNWRNEIQRDICCSRLQNLRLMHNFCQKLRLRGNRERAEVWLNRHRGFFIAKFPLHSIDNLADEFRISLRGLGQVFLLKLKPRLQDGIARFRVGQLFCQSIIGLLYQLHTHTHIVRCMAISGDASKTSVI